MLPLRLFRAAAATALFLLAPAASAFVAAPVGGHPGEVDASVRVAFERGKVEPNEYEGSWQKARWNTYSVGGGYTIGTVGPFDDLFVRLDNTFYTSPAESSDPDGLVHPEKGVPNACLGVVKANGVCEFHPSDRGWLLTPGVGANLVHKADFSFGLFLQGTIPIGVDLTKFTLPRVDWVAGGTQLGVHVTPWFGVTSRVYVGSGAKSGAGKQNPAVAITSLFVFEAKRWILPWKAGVSVGPYFEGDLGERFDEAYDAGYEVGYPARKDRIRAMKLGVAVLPYFRITDHFAVDAGYVQKLFGYDAVATQLYTVGMSGSY